MSLVYQIFPDRWLRGRKQRAVADGAWKWREHPIRFSSSRRQLTVNPSDQYTFYGGDLEGVRKKLDHLEELGVSMLYLTPIFAARSTHRYDAVDFRSIDPILGTREDFEALVRDLRSRGMRLVLDGVFNHTSEDHPWHRDERTRREFYIPRGPGRTMTWMDHGTLPKLDTQNPRVVREILSVLDAWPEADIWRLDAAHLLPQEMLRRLKKRVAPRPVVIEDWHSARHYFTQGLADGVTNFVFREALRTFFREDCSPETLFERLRAFIDCYPPEAVRASWNLLDNHDTPRFKTLVGRSRLMRALVLLFTLPGCPLLYHGAEVGMEGHSEGQSRSPMVWNEARWDRELFAHVRALSHLRRDHGVLREGSFEPLGADNRSRTLLFERRAAGARALVGLNDGYNAYKKGGVALGPGEWFVKVEQKGRKPRVLQGTC